MRKFTRAGFVKSLIGAASAPWLMFSSGRPQGNLFVAHLSEGFENAGTTGSSTDNLKTFGTAGKEELPHPGQELSLFFHEGEGCLTHMRFGGDWPGYESTRIRFYVDGETNASIDMQPFPGHGIGWNDQSAPWGSERVGKAGQPSGLYNTYRIPFGKSIKVTGQLGKTRSSGILDKGIGPAPSGRLVGTSLPRRQPTASGWATDPKSSFPRRRCGLAGGPEQSRARVVGAA